MSGESNLTHLQATLLALVVTVLWSSSWILIRWGLDDEALQPITFAALRYGLASVVLVAAVISRPSVRAHVGGLDRATWVRIVALGAVFYALTQGAQFVAIDNQPAATSSLVLSWTPLVVAGLSAWTLAEVPHRRQFAGAVLVVIGAWSYFAGDLGATVVGMAAALVGLGANAASSLMGRSLGRQGHVPPLVITALSMTIGSAILVVVGLSTEGLPAVSPRAWLIIAALAVVNTAVAFTLWNMSLRHLSAVESAGINNTMLIQIALLAWIFLDEQPGVFGLVGIVLVSMGIFLTQAAGLRLRTTSSSLGETRASRERA